MRSLLCLSLLLRVAHAAPPAELTEALNHFRSDPPPGWSFTQTSTGDGKSTVERFDASRPEFERWTLVAQNGKAPSSEEAQRYLESRSRRSRGGVAPKLADQLDLVSAEKTSETPERVTYRCHLKPPEAGDKTAEFLRATVVVHKPTRAVEKLELGSMQEFRPVFGVRIAEMRTTMSYSVPTGGTPSLPQKVEVRVRGRAFLVKSLDADMTVTFSDYVRFAKN